MRQKLPLSSSPAGQMNLVSQYNQVPLLQPNLPMPQYSQHSYSPTARPLMMPITSEQLMYKADDSPPNLGQGDTLQSRSMRPIGGERHLNIDPVIWATTKQSGKYLLCYHVHNSSKEYAYSRFLKPDL